jgi:hypothetical protein
MSKANLVAVFALFGFLLGNCYAQDNQDLAKQSQNPVSDLISLPFQNNTAFGIGEYERTQNVMNIQPVIPLNVGPVNVITRTVIPLIYQPDIAERDGGTFGLGGITATVFLSPAKPS